ncbi:ABC transporter substrate-binding protein [Georgenia deserti]|uniref:ABC transporter substrate-binding protein n=1 Tax=Georgenia deserti TaxID=2093781 RepID=A0ABW4L2D8_9MICO
MTLSRRRFLGGLGALTVAGGLAACSGDAGADERRRELLWWDHFGGLQDLHVQWAQDEGQRLGKPIEYTYNEPAQATEALQLANQSSQMPDVFSNILGLPLSALVEAGWLHAIDLSDEARARLPEGTLVEGVSMLDGALYGLPVLTDRQYWACTWYNADIAEEVGFGPPHSYDEFREALRAIARDGRYAPLTLAMGNADRMREQVDDLAQAGGFPGYEGLRYDTGEYQYDHDAYLNAIELLKEISQNGWLLPGTASLQIPDARGRWAAGNIGFFIDGPWAPGGVRNLNEAFLPKMAVAGELTPEGEDLVITRGAPAPTWFIGGTTPNPDLASRLADSFTTDEYQASLAEAMDQPPLNLDIVADADVIEPYAWLAEDFSRRVFRAPEPQVRNPDVAHALANTMPVAPHLGDIIQGYLGGDITDLRGQLRQLNDAFSDSLDSAIASAGTSGVAVDRSDWEFPDWVRGEDYTY